VDTGCHYAGESKEHLAIKEQIYRTCMSEGWETSVEFPAPDRSWISDVYATRNGRKIVFEIQISAISPDELAERDEKYRNEGIESYWLLDNFLGRRRDFAAWYDSYLREEGGRSPADIPYLDPSLFETGPENHIFIPKGIRSVGLSAKKLTLFTTNNPAIPPAVWVREVLKGNYPRYLEETAAAIHAKRRLMTLAAPDLIRCRELYGDILRSGTFRKKADSSCRIFRAGAAVRNGKALQKKSDELSAEIDWLEKEYRSFMADSYGLFTWKKIPGQDAPRPFFRPEPASAIRKLRECVEMFDRWEASFKTALGVLEQEFRTR
jgi:competence protein CoiA